MKRSICNRCHSLRRGVNNACCSRNCASLSSSATLSKVRLLPSTTLLCNHQQLQQQRSSPLINKRLFSSSLPTTTPSQSNLLPQTEDPYAHNLLVPIDFPTSSLITGEESQILEVNLKPNQMLRAESGAMLYMTHGVVMETSMGLGGGSSGQQQQSGLSAGFTRMMTGQNLMVSNFTYTPISPSNDDQHQEQQQQYGTVGLGTDFPAKILKFPLHEYPESKLICQKGAYLAGSHSVAMEMAYTKSFTSGFFGGEGFILQSLQGTKQHDGGDDETVFLKAYGTVVKKEIKDGETLRVSSGSLVCMTSTVDYDVTTMPGFKNVMFGGEGLFVTTLTGPGIVWLQGMPIDRMVSEIARHIPSGGGIGLGIPIGMGGGGGGEGTADAAAGDMAAGDVAEEASSGAVDADGVPVTDAAVDADRNATVASSGVMGESDPESSESLFGDAAYGGGSTPEDQQLDTFASSNEDSFSTTDDFSQPNENDDNIMPEFEEPTLTEQQFEDDGTKFSTYEGNDGSAGAGEGVEAPDDEGPSLLGQLWDMFRDFTDEE